MTILRSTMSSRWRFDDLRSGDESFMLRQSFDSVGQEALLYAKRWHHLRDPERSTRLLIGIEHDDIDRPGETLRPCQEAFGRLTRQDVASAAAMR